MEENKQSTTSGKDFLAGVLIGSIAGAVTALLLAPKSGRELRKDLNDQVSIVLEKSDNVKDAVRQKGADWLDYANEAKFKITKTVQDQTKDIVEKVQTLTKNTEVTAEETLEETKKAIAELSDEIDQKLENMKK